MTDKTPAKKPFIQSMAVTLANESMSSLCRAVASFLDSVPGITLQSSVSQIHAALGIHRQAAWQIQRLAVSANPIQDTANVPSVQVMSNLMGRTSKIGADRAAVETMRTAFQSFHKLVERYADDQETFSIMIASSRLASSGRVPYGIITEKHRSDNYKSLAKILGIRAFARVSTFAFAPSQNDPMRQDCLRLDFHRDIWQLRSGVTWVYSQMKPKARGTADVNYNYTPLDPEGEQELGFPVIRQFSSFSPSHVRSREGQRNTEFHCTWDDFGRAGTHNCATGLYRSAYIPRFADDSEDKESMLHCTVDVTTPCEQFVMDTLIHRDLPPRDEPRVTVYADHTSPSDMNELDRKDPPLPVDSSVIYMGSAAQIALPLVHRYREMIDFAFDKVGWDLEDFMLYRYQLKFPITPSTTRMSWPVRSVDD